MAENKSEDQGPPHSERRQNNSALELPQCLTVPLDGDLDGSLFSFLL